MAKASVTDRVADAWLLLGAAAIVGATVALLTTGLLWTVPAPGLVAALVLLVAAGPTVVYAVRRGRREWWVPAVAVALAIGASIAVVANYQPPGSALRPEFAATPLPGWPGAGQLVVIDDCRYWCFINDGSTGSQLGLEITSTDVQGDCLRMAEQLVAAGWTKSPPLPNTDWCTVELTKPAPLGQTYIIDLSVSPDSASPLMDLANGPPEKGRVFTGLRVVSSLVV